tara:strand:- start:72781 stop:73269 length:489 start_codon:yes stop_codon:yes gene_type:complete
MTICKSITQFVKDSVTDIIDLFTSKDTEDPSKELVEERIQAIHDFAKEKAQRELTREEAVELDQVLAEEMQEKIADNSELADKVKVVEDTSGKDLDKSPEPAPEPDYVYMNRKQRRFLKLMGWNISPTTPVLKSQKRMILNIMYRPMRIEAKRKIFKNLMGE